MSEQSEPQPIRSAFFSPAADPYAEILNLQQHRLEDGERIQAMQQEMAEAMEGGLLESLVSFFLRLTFF